MDEFKVVHYIARGDFGRDLGRRAICVEGTEPPDDGTRWVRDPARPLPTSYSAEQLRLLKERGWFIATRP
jgi:hypothetical protein